MVEERLLDSSPEEVAWQMNPLAFRLSWVIRGGELSSGITLSELLNQMEPKDVYIKGANALDINGNVGILIGNLVEGGRIGRVTAKAQQRGFQMIFPVGLEKLISIPIKQATKESLKN